MKYGVGDVITFKQDLKIITHRVVEIEKKNDSNSYVTKGDNNNLEDSKKVQEEDIKGKVTLTVRYLGNLIELLDNQIFFLILILIFLILILYKINIKEKKENRREKKKIEEEKRNDKNI